MRSAEKHHWKLYGRCKGITFLNWHLSDNTATLCRAEQLVSYLTELDTACSCQTGKRSKAASVKNVSKTDSFDNSDERVVCEDSISTNSECRDSPHTSSDSGDSAAGGNICPKSRCTLLGLHACADLSPIIIKVFRDCVQASSLLLLSCCYHKMSLCQKAPDQPMSEEQESSPKSSDNSKPRPECSSDGDPPRNGEELSSAESDFLNFPMSQSLQEVFRQSNFQMSVYGLRLGAQKSGQDWCTETLEDHEYHMRNVAYRGILEAACVEGIALSLS